MSPLNKFKLIRHWKNSQGFTIWEVMVALTVLIIGILSLARLFPLALQVSKSAEQNTIAMNLAQAKIEEAAYLGYGNIPVGSFEAKHRLANDPENPFYYYLRETNAYFVNATDFSTTTIDTGIKKVTTIVYWNSPILSSEKSREVIILISKK